MDRISIMPKPSTRSYSRYAQDAADLLGVLIRRARIERRMTVEELAERAGMSRGLVQRIERGDMGCAVGAVFEAAAVVGVRLFDADGLALQGRLRDQKGTLALLPQAARASVGPVKDDF